MRFPRSFTQRVCIVLLLPAAACKGAEADAILVRVANDGASNLTDVKVWADKGTPIEAASLAPGASTGYARTDFYYYWFASATVNGKQVSYSSFLDLPARVVRLDPGRYTVELFPDAAHGSLNAELIRDE